MKGSKSRSKLNHCGDSTATSQNRPGPEPKREQGVLQIFYIQEDGLETVGTSTSFERETQPAPKIETCLEPLAKGKNIWGKSGNGNRRFAL